MVVKVVLKGNFISENNLSLTLNATLDMTPTVSYLEPDVRSARNFGQVVRCGLIFAGVYIVLYS